MKRRLALAGAVTAAVWMGGTMIAPPALATPGNPAGAAQASVQPWPITITIRTVPPLAGVRFKFDGSALVTGRHGTASITQQHNFSLHTLRLIRPELKRPGRRYRFVRWAGQRDPNQAYLTKVRGLPMRANYTVTAGFAVACPVAPHFSYQQGGVLDPARISLITLRANTGQERTLRPTGRTWLPCQVPVYRDSSLSGKPVWYSVQSIMVGGTNVTAAGTQRFRPDADPYPALVGNFHNLTITAHDALFGSATGSVAEVTMPNRSVRVLALGPGHLVTLRNLPQGDYQVVVKAGGAMVSTQSLRLSRNQAVDLTAVSPADLATLGGVLLMVLAGLPLLSRQRRTHVLGVGRRLGTGLAHSLRTGLLRLRRGGAST